MFAWGFWVDLRFLREIPRQRMIDWMEETAFPMAIFGRVDLLFSNKTEEIRKKLLVMVILLFSGDPKMQEEDVLRIMNDFYVKKAYLCAIS